jgi:hypothetical protein
MSSQESSLLSIPLYPYPPLALSCACQAGWFCREHPHTAAQRQEVLLLLHSSRLRDLGEVACRVLVLPHGLHTQGCHVLESLNIEQAWADESRKESRERRQGLAPRGSQGPEAPRGTLLGTASAPALRNSRTETRANKEVGEGERGYITTGFYPGRILGIGRSD